MSVNPGLPPIPGWTSALRKPAPSDQDNAVAPWQQKLVKTTAALITERAQFTGKASQRTRPCQSSGQKGDNMLKDELVIPSSIVSSTGPHAECGFLNECRVAVTKVTVEAIA